MQMLMLMHNGSNIPTGEMFKRKATNETCVAQYVGRYETNTSNFSLKFKWNDNEINMHNSYMFAIMRLFFHKVYVIFNILLPTLSITLYINAVKFPASTSEHITKTLFHFFVICKMAAT
jgi:hypothetical protein